LPKVVRVTVRFLLVSILLCALIVSSAGLLLPDGHAQPVLMLSSGSAQVGLEISVSGTGFLPTDTACTFSSPSSGVLVSSSACVAQGGLLSGSFIVGNVPIGAYVVQASGNMGDSAQTILDVSGGAQLQLNPTTGGPGVDVVVQGSGFLPTDTTCSISSPSTPNPILPGSGACVIQNGRAIGSFLIGNVPMGEYVIRLTGNQGDSAQALVDVG
jgi:hypothetical protein